MATVAKPVQNPERFKNRVHIGMTQEQVIANWGKPDERIKKSSGEYDEVWGYKPHWKIKNLLYFKNGVVIGGDPNPENLI